MAELSLPERDIIIICLLGLANFLPILGRLVLKDRFSWPVDLGLRWTDRRPVLGPHKTWRGILLSVAGTGAAGCFLPVGCRLACLVALFSMTGDLVSSFVKRRMGLESGSRAVGLDQVVESGLPLVFFRAELGITWPEIMGLVAVFSILNIGLSPILFRFRIRRRPH